MIRVFRDSNDDNSGEKTKHLRSKRELRRKKKNVKDCIKMATDVG